MGRRGPQPKPTALKELQGNPGKRSLPKHEAKPLAVMPTAPQWMSVEAKRLWRHIAKDLHACGLLTRVDRTALALLCETFSDYLAAREMVMAVGLVAESEKGGVYQHPAVSMRNTTRRDLLQLLREFGMTPSARARIAIEQDQAEKTLADELFEIAEKMTG